jgi:uncharacterized protein (DUF305 family)
MVTKRRPTPGETTAPPQPDAPPPTWSWGKIIGFGVACTFLGACLMFAANKFNEGRVDDASLGFVQDMIDHHDQAVQMSIRIQAVATDPTVLQIASDIVQEQRYELGMMDSWLAQWNSQRGEDDRIAMQWMGMGSPVNEMMGMQDPEAVRSLSKLPAQDAELFFLKMMQEHHRGGVDMAKYAAENAGKANVRTFAERVASVQAAEINEMQAVIDRLEDAR